MVKTETLFLRSLKAEGEVSEWLKEHAWKVCIVETLSRVRIPPSPLKSVILDLKKSRKPANTVFAGFLDFKLPGKYFI